VVSHYVLQTRKAKGRVINAGITIAENSTSALVLPFFPSAIQAADSTMMNFEKNSLSYHNQLIDMKYGAGTLRLYATPL